MAAYTYRWASFGTARRFHPGIFAFEVSVGMEVARLSTGGYQHHIGMSIFSSFGTEARAASLGSGRVDVDVPTVDDLEALHSRLKDHRIRTRQNGRTLSFEGPWNFSIHVPDAESQTN